MKMALAGTDSRAELARIYKANSISDTRHSGKRQRENVGANAGMGGLVGVGAGPARLLGQRDLVRLLRFADSVLSAKCGWARPDAICRRMIAWEMAAVVAASFSRPEYSMIPAW